MKLSLIDQLADLAAARAYVEANPAEIESAIRANRVA